MSEGLGVACAQLGVAARCGGVYCALSSRNFLLDLWPTCCPEHDDRNATACKVLLIPEILIGGDKNFVPFGFCRGDEFTVHQGRPTTFVRRCDLMACERTPQGGRGSVIKEDPHLCNGERTAGSVLQHGARLVQTDSWKPLQELMDRRVVFEVLEESGDRDARPLEHPGTTHPRGVALDSRAGGPVDHGRDGSTGGGLRRLTFELSRPQRQAA